MSMAVISAQYILQEDPEITDFKNAAADTAHDVKESVKPDDKASTKSGNEKTVLESVSTVAAKSPPLVPRLSGTAASANMYCMLQVSDMHFITTCIVADMLSQHRACTVHLTPVCLCTGLRCCCSSVQQDCTKRRGKGVRGPSAFAPGWGCC